MILLVPVSIRAVVATDPVKARVVRATNFHATISITGVLWRARSALWPAWCVNAVSAREAGRFVIATRRRSRRGHRWNCGITRIRNLSGYRYSKKKPRPYCDSTDFRLCLESTLMLQLLMVNLHLSLLNWSESQIFENVYNPRQNSSLCSFFP